jgi:hypothetical protein
LYLKKKTVDLDLDAAIAASLNEQGIHSDEQDFPLDAITAELNKEIVPENEY